MFSVKAAKNAYCPDINQLLIFCETFLGLKMSQTLDMSLANVADKHSEEILKKFKWAIKRVVNEQESGEDEEPSLTQEELIELIRVWEPQ